MSGTTTPPTPAAPTPSPTAAKPPKTVWQELDTWGAGLPRWQRYALTRAVANLRLTDAEVDIAFALLIADAGLAPDPNPLPAIPATITGRPQTIVSPFQIAGLENTAHINALPANASLTFGPQLTVVYGRNGAGKSGFFRVLSWACFSRSRRQILPNVFTKGAAPTPSADVVVLDAPATPLRRFVVTDKMPDTDLRRVAVFDAQIADVHVQKKDNPFSFRPAGFDVFTELVRVIGLLEARLDLEMKARTSENSFLNLLAGVGETPVHALLSTLSTATKDDAVRALGTFGETEKARFAEVSRQLAELRATSVEHLRKAAAQDRADVAALLVSLQAAGALIDAEHLRGYESSLKDLAEQERLAASESLAALKGARLKALGTPAWQRFVQAAQELARGEGEKYPAPGQPCLLCHRPVDNSAHDVLHATWRYLQGAARRKVEEIRKTLATSATTLHEATLDVYGPSTRVRAFLDRTAPELSRNIVAAIDTLKSARDGVEKVLVAGTGALPAAPSPSAVVPALTAAVAALDAGIVRLNALTKEDAIKALTREYTELRHREVLTNNLAPVLKWLGDARWVEKATAAKKKLLATRPITDKESALADALLGPGFERVFSEELKALDCPVPLEPQMKGRGGQTVRTLALTVNHKTEEVLSEGEQRAVALADFFTEVTLNPTSAGIVLDDPVTSLDNDRKERIAHRLVAESLKRQVIVFTHDMEFLALLCERSERDKVAVVTHWVDRDGAGVPGRVALNDRPETSRLYSDAEHAKAKLKEVKAVVGTPRLAALWHGFGVLRTAVEHLVLKKLFNDVVSPYRRHVKMMSLDKLNWSGDAAKAAAVLHVDISSYIDAHFRPDGAAGSDPAPEKLEGFIARYEELRKQMPKHAN